MHHEPRRVWSIGLLLPLAVLGPPILAFGLVGGLPRTPSANGSVIGLKLYPLAALALMILGAARAEPGATRMTFLVIAGGSSCLWGLIVVLGMLAP